MLAGRKTTLGLQALCSCMGTLSQLPTTQDRVCSSSQSLRQGLLSVCSLGCRQVQHAGHPGGQEDDLGADWFSAHERAPDPARDDQQVRLIRVPGASAAPALSGSRHSSSSCRASQVGCSLLPQDQSMCQRIVLERRLRLLCGSAAAAWGFTSCQLCLQLQAAAGACSGGDVQHGLPGQIAGRRHQGICSNCC